MRVNLDVTTSKYLRIMFSNMEHIPLVGEKLVIYNFNAPDLELIITERVFEISPNTGDQLLKLYAKEIDKA